MPDLSASNSNSGVRAVGAEVSAGDDTAGWSEVTAKASLAVAKIIFSKPQPFEWGGYQASQATAFVVDAKKGIALTNRHVVGAGPIRGCLEFGTEQVDFRVIYLDAVHDFAFVQYNPADIKFTEIGELELRPESAKVNTPVRLIGNDGGEKGTILSAVISRLDRNAPVYTGLYSDHNTSYIQAAAGACGGSSGSPVIDKFGHVVALQAGGRDDKSTIAYFLRLHFPLEVLKKIRANEKIERGTIGTVLTHQEFHECRKRGLNAELEKAAREGSDTATGLLTVSNILPESSADGKLQVGDILLKLNNKPIFDFISFETFLHNNVGGSVDLTVLRDKTCVSVSVGIDDLHKLSPGRYVSVSGGSFHDIPYHVAVRFNVPPCKGGVTVAWVGSRWNMGPGTRTRVITKIDNRPVDNLDMFIDVMKTIPDRKCVSVQYYHVTNRHQIEVSVLHTDRHWDTKMVEAVRDDKTWTWKFSTLADPIPAEKLVPAKGTFTQLQQAPSEQIAGIARSVVDVKVYRPYHIDGIDRPENTTTGFVLSAERGLVLISSTFLLPGPCDVLVVIANSISVSGKVVIIHPTCNYAIIKYDPSLVDAPVKSIELAPGTAKQGDEVIFMGFQSGTTVIGKAEITSFEPLDLPAPPQYTKFRPLNLETMVVSSQVANNTGTGLFVNNDGTVCGLWIQIEVPHRDPKEIFLSSIAIDPAVVCPVLDRLLRNEKASVKLLGIEAKLIDFEKGRAMGVPPERIQQAAEAYPAHQKLVTTSKVEAGSKCGLREGDILLTADGKVMGRMSDLNCQFESETIAIELVRDGKVMTVQAKTTDSDEGETSRAFAFSGLLVQEPPRAIRHSAREIPSGAFIRIVMCGSAANLYGVEHSVFVTGINDMPTQSVEEVIEAVMKIPDNVYFNLKTVSRDCHSEVKPMRRDDVYSPMIEIWREESECDGIPVIEWRTRQLSPEPETD